MPVCDLFHGLNKNATLKGTQRVDKDIEIDDTVRVWQFFFRILILFFVRPYFIKSNDMLCSFKTELWKEVS